MFKALNRTILASLVLLSSLTPAFAQEETRKSRMSGESSENVTRIKADVLIDWTEGVIEVRGVGTPPDRGAIAQKRLKAERDALAAARRKLATTISEIYVNSETLVRDFATESDAINARISSLIKGAQRLEQTYLDNGTVEVYLAVKIYAQEGLSGILQAHKHEVPPPPVELAPEKAPGEYTGVIVDCRGLGLMPAISPALISPNGGELYLGQNPVSPEFVIENGIIGYERSLLQARKNKRVGSNPLIVKGLRADGNLKTDVIVSEADTRQIMGLDAQYKILAESRVIFVM